MNINWLLASVVLNLFLLLMPSSAMSLDYSVDITNLEAGGVDNVPVTFAYPFLKGEYPSNQSFSAVLSNGQSATVQTDFKASHSDGSLRHAIFSTILPSLNKGETTRLTLKPSTAPAGTVITTSDIADSIPNISVDIKLSGKVYTGSLNDVVSSPEQTWLSGPVASEYIYIVPLKSGSDALPYLAVRMYVRHYSVGKTKVDVVVENNWTFQSGLSNQTYDVTIKVGAETAYSFTNLIHYKSARWKKTIWVGEGVETHVAHNASTLIDTMAVPSYDKALINHISASQYLAKNLGEVVSVSGGSVGKYSPMGIGSALEYMPNTGGRRDIGPLPDWNTAFLLDQGKNTKDFALAMADSAGSWPIHYRDKSTGLPVSITDYPTLSTHPNNPLQPVACAGSCSVPYTPDTSHQPQFDYIPYLVTGDFFYLEELQFWANYNVLSIPADTPYRDNAKGYLYGQWRGIAWSLRTNGWTAFITPDDQPLKGYFTAHVQNNIEKLSAKYIEPEVNSYGAPIPYGAYDEGELSAWQDDFFTWSLANLMDLGFETAEPLAKWKARLAVRRMGKGEPGNQYCWLHGAPYLLKGVYVDSTFAASINDIWTATAPSDVIGKECGSGSYLAAAGLSAGEMEGYPDSAQGFATIMQIALASAVNLGVDDSQASWSIYEARSVKPPFDSYPNWAIVPREEVNPPSAPVVRSFSQQ